MVDGAAGWLGYQVYDLDVVAVEKKPDGRVFYNAAAWVRADSEIAAAHLDDDPDTIHLHLCKERSHAILAG